jgi:hypothetical protein
MTAILIILSVWLIFGIICYFVAEKKNRNSTAWFIWGIVLGALALGCLLLEPED